MTRPDRDGPLPILANFRSIFVGRLVSALSMWLALVILAKLADPVTVGIYALAQATCIPLGEIAKMGLREVRSSDTRNEFQFGDYFGLRLVATVVALGAMIAAGIAQGTSAALIAVMVFFALARSVELVSDIVYSLFQAHERMDYTGRSLSMTGILSLVALTLGYWITESLVYAVIGQFVAHLLVLVVYTIPMGRHRVDVVADDIFRPSWKAGPLYRLTVRSLPLTVATLMVMIAQSLPRLSIEHVLGLSALGIFAPILALAMAPDRLVNSLGMAFSVRLAQRFAAGQLRAYVLLLGRVAGGLALCCGAGLVICDLYGAAILRLVYTEAYAEQSDLLFLLAAAVSCRLIANILRFGLIASRHFWWLTAQSAVVAVVALASCFVLIPAYGLWGAGLSVLIISVAQLLVISVGLSMTVLHARKRLQ